MAGHDMRQRDAERREDGRGEIEIADDGLSAYCKLVPPIGNGKAVNAEYIQSLIQASGIVTPVDWNRVKSEINRSAETREVITFILSKGTVPVPAIPGHLKLKKRFFLAATANGSPQPDEIAGRVDYRDVQPFALITKDEPIARVVKRIEGKPGKKVTGDVIPPGEREILHFSPGEHLVLKDGRYRAAIDGHFICNDGVIDVSSILHINGDVDFHTGHLQFPGDVVINGGIKRGFHILITGNLSCSGTIEATDMTIGKSLFCKEGIIGFPGNKVKIGGSLECKFLENVYLEVRKKITVSDSIFNCNIYSMDEIHTEDESKVIAGELHGINGVSLANIGNEIGRYSSVEAGSDFVLARQIQKLQNMKLRYRLKQDTLEELVKLGIQNDVLSERVLGQLKELELLIQKKTINLEKNNNAKIEIRGTLYPGVLLKICSASLYIREKMSNTVFFLKENRIQSKSLDP